MAARKAEIEAKAAAEAARRAGSGEHAFLKGRKVAEATIVAEASGGGGGGGGGGAAEALRVVPVLPMWWRLVKCAPPGAD